MIDEIKLPKKTYAFHFKTGPLPRVEAENPVNALREICRVIADNPLDYLGKGVSCWEVPA